MITTHLILFKFLAGATEGDGAVVATCMDALERGIERDVPQMLDHDMTCKSQ